MKSRKLLKKKSKRILTLEAKYGEEETARLIHEWTSKAGKAKGKPKGFATNLKLASEAGKKGQAARAKNGSDKLGGYL